ncbi:hypothetical protein ACVRZR_01255 [Streptococcus entericus]|uniref:hypothetical protein n=1 Tax=Streptococcus entericus TaxID=155680 RepID=UPI00039C6FA8|nr:hypothetical protein [Streptococcus entericus]
MPNEIYGAILDSGERAYTLMSEVFAPLSLKIEDYNWLVSHYWIYHIDDIPWDKDYTWLTGEQLGQVFEKYPAHQWIWAVLSGFDKEVSLEEALSYPLPHPESEELWQLPLTCLHPLVCHEIVAWDSTLTLVKSVQKEVVDSFREAFPLSDDLKDRITSYEL